jgi:hypothetical protein
MSTGDSTLQLCVSVSVLHFARQCKNGAGAKKKSESKIIPVRVLLVAHRLSSRFVVRSVLANGRLWQNPTQRAAGDATVASDTECDH